MFYQDPFLLYQQTPFCHGNSGARNPQNRSSFRIDDILVPRQPFLVPKQPSFQEPRSSAPNANPLKFGMHSILTQRQRDDVPMFQGGLSSLHHACILHAKISLRTHLTSKSNAFSSYFQLLLYFFYDFVLCQVSRFYSFNCWFASLRKNYPFS